MSGYVFEEFRIMETSSVLKFHRGKAEAREKSSHDAAFDQSIPTPRFSDVSGPSQRSRKRGRAKARKQCSHRAAVRQVFRFRGSALQRYFLNSPSDRQTTTKAPAWQRKQKSPAKKPGFEIQASEIARA